jgi:hypothetical protein
MSRKPRTVLDLVFELRARSEWLGKSAVLLRRGSEAIAEAFNPDRFPQDRTLRGIPEYLDWMAETRRHLKAAGENVRQVERLLRDDLKGVRHAVVLVERELGTRKLPGRPLAMTAAEIRLATLEREEGRSWEQVRRTLNQIRRTERVPRPALPLTTVRTAVRRAAAAEKPTGSFH